MTTAQTKDQMLRNAAEIVRLHNRIHETLKERSTSDAGRSAWQRACAEFHARYSQLAFPGGYGEALEKFRARDTSVVEPALCFLELRPYFFRSGYMFNTLLRRMRHIPLTPAQQKRLDAVRERQAAWKALKSQQQ
jgi:hypothetical protein